MLVLITGDRYWNNKNRIYTLLDRIKDKYPDLQIIQGGCSGVDTIANQWCSDNNISNITVNADWLTYGKAAGPIRNKYMIERYNPKVVIAFHNNLDSSRGTKNTVELATKNNIKVLLVTDDYIKTYPSIAQQL